MSPDVRDHLIEHFISDKTMLCVLVVLILAMWAFVREPKLFDLVNLFAGALIALITGQVFRRNNGNGNGQGNQGS